MKFHTTIEGCRELPQPLKTIENKVVEVNDNGSVQRCYQRVEIDPLKVNEGLKTTDFSLDVLISSNATELLKPSKIIPMSNLAVAATVENFE